MDIHKTSIRYPTAAWVTMEYNSFTNLSTRPCSSNSVVEFPESRENTLADYQSVIAQCDSRESRLSNSLSENILESPGRQTCSLPSRYSSIPIYVAPQQPTNEDCNSFERKPESAQLIFASNSGLGRFLSTEFVNHAEAESFSGDPASTYTGSLLQNIKREIQDNWNVVTKGKPMDNFQKDFDINAKIVACAACGIREPQMGQTHYLRVELQYLQILQYNDGALAEFNEIPEQYRGAVSSYQDPVSLARFHLHPELVDIDNQQQASVMLCPRCHSAVSTHTIPRYAIANGVDFGNPRRLGFPNLTLVEETLIARGVILVSIIKLMGQTTLTRQWAKRGHAICFPQPSGVSLFVEHTRIEEKVHRETYPRLESVHENLSVIFIGLRKQWDSMVAAGNVHVEELTVRPEVVFRCLKALKYLNPLYRQIEIDDSDEMARSMTKLPESLFAKATVIEDEIDREIENTIVPDAVTDVCPGEAGCEPTITNISIPSSLLCSSSNIPIDKLALNRLAFQGLHSAMTQEQTILGDTLPENVFELQDCHTQQTVSESFDNQERQEDSDEPSDNESNDCLPTSFTEDDMESERGIRSERPRALNLPHSEQPINEFRNNDQLLYSCFPLLFLLGKGLLSSGPLKLEAKRHILLQYDQRHGGCARLNFLLFNKDQRHHTDLATSSYIKSQKESTTKFADWARDPNFLHRLREAERNPSSPTALQLLKEITPHVRTVASKIPYSAGQRKSVVSKLYAMTYYHGLPNFFITFAPDDVHGLLNIRLSVPQTSNTGFPMDGTGLAESLNASEVAFQSIPIGDSALRHLLTQGYVAGAEIFRLMTDAVFHHLFRTPSEIASKRTTPLPQRESGVFGVPVASFGVTEEQARGSLHMHVLYWGGLPTWLLQTAAGISALMGAIAKAIDQVIQCTVNPEHHVASLLNLQAGIKPTYHPVAVQVINPDHNLQRFQKQVHDLIVLCNLHQHTTTCKKGKTGDELCRVAHPQPLVQQTKCTQVDPDDTATPPQLPYCVLSNVRPPALETTRQRQLESLPVPLRDSRSIFWENERETIRPLENRSAIEEAQGPHLDTSNGLRVSQTLQDRFDNLNAEQQAALNSRLLGRNGLIVEYNDILSACVGCNTNVSLLGSDMQAKAGSIYVIKYISKAVAPITQAIAIIRNARSKMDKYPSIAEDADTIQRTGQLFLTRLVNEISGMIEVSAMMAAASNLGMPAETSSCRFFYVFVGSAIKYFQEHQETTYDNDKREVFDIDVENETDGESDSETEAGCSNIETTDPQSISLQLDSEPDFLNSEQAQYEEGATDNFATAHIFQSDHGPVPVPQHIHYADRGPHLAKYSLYEYAGIIDVVKKNPKGGPSENATRVGRPSNTTFDFGVNHPLHATRVQRLRSKTAVPVTWPRPPNPPTAMPSPRTANWERTAFTFLTYILTLFRPWSMVCEDGGTLPGRLTWKDFCSFMRELEFGKVGESPTSLGLIRFRWIKNMAHGMRVTAAERKAGQAYRFRAATRWGHPDCSKPFVRSGATVERCNEGNTDEEQDNLNNDLAREAEAAIEALRDVADTGDTNHPIANEKEEAFLHAAMESLDDILKSTVLSHTVSKQDLLQRTRSLVHHGIDREDHENEQLAILKELENDVADCSTSTLIDKDYSQSTPRFPTDFDKTRLNEDNV